MSKFSFVDADKGDNMSDDNENEDQYDRSAYDILEFAQAGYPCLSFDFLRGSLYETVQANCNYQLYLLVGSQADAGNNSLTLMYLSNIHKIQHKKSEDQLSDDDEDSDESQSDHNDDTDHSPVFEYASFRHQGVCNRIRCTDFSNCAGVNAGCERNRPYAASWSENGNVYIWNLEKPLEAVQNAQAMSQFVRAHGRQYYATFVHDAHSVEGFALDWSTTNLGHLITGDRSGCIKLLHLGSKSDWQEVSLDYNWHKGSVEDLQWSPCEQTVFASGSTDRCIAIWDTRIGKKCQLSIKNAHASDVNVISWNRKESTLLASGGDDGCIKVWDLRLLVSSDNSTITANHHSNAVNSVQDQCTSMVASFAYHKQPITSIEWNPNDSSVLAASSEDGEITLWDLAVEKVIPSNALTESLPGTDMSSIPAQMMFNHGGLVDIKEIHWHKGIAGLVGSTSASGFCFFKSISI